MCRGLYSVLGVTQSASKSTIRQAYAAVFQFQIILHVHVARLTGDENKRSLWLLLKHLIRISLGEAYLRLAKRLHPDVNKGAGAQEQFQQLRQAYEVLSDETTRREHDKKLGSLHGSARSAPHPGATGHPASSSWRQTTAGPASARAKSFRGAHHQACARTSV